MKKYTVTVKVQFDVFAEDEQDARVKAIEQVSKQYVGQDNIEQVEEIGPCLDKYLDSLHQYWMMIQTKHLRNLNLPYYQELKEILWKEMVLPSLKKAESKLSYNNRGEEETYFRTITKNHCITNERSIQIYLSPEDPLHQRQVKDNGRIWGRIITLAKRERNLSVLEI